MVRRMRFFLAVAVIVDHELHRIEHRDAPGRDFIQMLAHAVLEHRKIDP